MQGLPFSVGRYMIVGDRAYQQDACDLCRGETLLFAVLCDGMGGMEGGELASKTAVSAIMERFTEQPPASLSEAPPWMYELFIEADRRVSELTREDGSFMGAGSTCLMLAADEKCFVCGCVGDSRIALLRGGKLHTLTRMHNYSLKLEEMLETGEITQEEAIQESARGEALISYLGMRGLERIDVMEPSEWRSGDVMIICSDGLYKALDDQQIQAIVEESGGNMQLAASRLCDEAYRLAVRKQDNTTVIAIRYLG